MERTAPDFSVTPLGKGGRLPAMKHAPEPNPTLSARPRGLSGQIVKRHAKLGGDDDDVGEADRALAAGEEVPQPVALETAPLLDLGDGEAGSGHCGVEPGSDGVVERFGLAHDPMNYPEISGHATEISGLHYGNFRGRHKRHGEDRMSRPDTILHRRIVERLKETGRSASEVAVAAGAKQDFITDFLAGRKKSMNMRAMVRIAQELDRPLAWFYGEEDIRSEDVANAIPTPPPSKRIPVYGTAAGSRLGASHYESDVIDWVPAPPGLDRIRDAYMLFVDGSSMEPRYRHRDPIFVAPHQPPWPGDDVVILIRKPKTGEYQTWVKELVNINPDEIVARQHNPSGELRFRRSEVVEMHRILPLGEIVGLKD